MTPAQSIGIRLQRARKAAGLSLRAMAEAVGVSHTLIDKYESGVLTPNSQQLIELAKPCGVKVEYFLRPSALSALRVEYRLPTRHSIKTKNRIEGAVLDQAERRFGLERLFPVPPSAPYRTPAALPAVVTCLADIEALTLALRSAWALGTDPIGSMVDVLENHGIRVFPTSGCEDAFDGLLMQVAGDDLEPWPIVLLDPNWPGDRQRFTLAHELGHLLVHDRFRSADQSDDDKPLTEERACNAFAGALLLPADVLKRHLGERRTAIEPRELYLIKQAYGVSMSAIVVRAKQVGIISEAICKTWLSERNAKGWNTLEPGEPYPAERPRQFEHLVYRALAEEIIGESKAAELLGLSLVEFRKQRQQVVSL